MSNTVLKCHSLITSITINGNVKVPDGEGNITIPSSEATALMVGTQKPQQVGPITVVQTPVDPTT